MSTIVEKINLRKKVSWKKLPNTINIEDISKHAKNYFNYVTENGNGDSLATNRIDVISP